MLGGVNIGVKQCAVAVADHSIGAVNTILSYPPHLIPH